MKQLYPLLLVFIFYSPFFNTAHGQCNKILMMNVDDFIATSTCDGSNMATFRITVDVEISGGNPSVCVKSSVDGGVNWVNSICWNNPINVTDQAYSFTAPCNADFQFAGWTNPDGGGTNCTECGEGGGEFACPPIDLTNPLPVDLVSFKANLEKERVVLEWVTASEENNDFFTLEHSLDGHDFSAIGKIDGRGTTDEFSYYSFIDSRPGDGLNYYRLKQTDYDGAFEYSDIIAVRIEVEDTSIKLLPTNTVNSLTVFFYETFEKDSPVELFDLLGNKLMDDVLVSGENELTFDVSHLTPGSYVIRIRGERDFILKRFNKMRM